MTLRRSAFLAGTILLILACGGADDGTFNQVAEDLAAVEPAAAQAGSWPATNQGVCQMLSDCGCSEYASVQDCLGQLGPNLSSIGSGVHGCIVGQDCASMCNGGGVSCVNSAAAQSSADSKRAHDINMEIIGNFPTGGNCPSGQTQVVDSSGRFLRCQ